MTKKLKTQNRSILMKIFDLRDFLGKFNSVNENFQRFPRDFLCVSIVSWHFLGTFSASFVWSLSFLCVFLNFHRFFSLFWHFLWILIQFSRLYIIFFHSKPSNSHFKLLWLETSIKQCSTFSSVFFSFPPLISQFIGHKFSYCSIVTHRHTIKEKLHK